MIFERGQAARQNKGREFQVVKSDAKLKQLIDSKQLREELNALAAALRGNDTALRQAAVLSGR